MRSKRLRTTEEPVGLGESSALSSSKRKSLGGPSGPKVRRSATGTACKEEEKEKKKKTESKHNHNPNSVQLSGKRLKIFLEDITLMCVRTIETFCVCVLSLLTTCVSYIFAVLTQVSSFYLQQVPADRCVWSR